MRQRARRLSGHHRPASIDPATGTPYGSRFPIVSIRDMVRTQASLADHLGVRRWRAVVGGSMGGMQALEWGVMYPDRVDALVLASTTAQASAQQIAWSHIGRHGDRARPGLRGGDYYDAARATVRTAVWSLARRWPRSPTAPTRSSPSGSAGRCSTRSTSSLDQRFDVEGYLDYHGDKLVRRFDANSYLRLNRAMDLHDLGRGRGGVERALGRVRAPVLVASVRSDSLYPPCQQRQIRDALRRRGVRGALGRHRLAPRPRRVPDRDRPARTQIDSFLVRSETACVRSAREQDMTTGGTA